MQRKFCIFTAALLSTSSWAEAGYAAVPMSSAVVADPFFSYVRTTYPGDCATVRDAVTWLLEGTGWSLASAEFAPSEASAILGQLIEPIARLPRTMSRLDAMQILIGAENTLVIDRSHRLLSFTSTAKVMP